MAIYDIGAETNTVIPNAPHCELAEWIPGQNKFVGMYSGTFYLVDAATGENTIIKQNCGDKYRYSSFSVSPDGSKILSQRITSIQIDSTTYSISNDIVIMNIDGSNEQVIELPQ